ncbi:tRNA pseudouridine(55) synthase TruB [bacterium]|nr:tRNA pseudouridine(55) synthase TruB [bacterium]
MKTLQSMMRNEFAEVDFESGQVLNVNKPAGWTSFDAVKCIRGITKVRKVGHAGTLDPFATGILLVCTGKATKKVSELMGLTKEYEAEIELGKTTDTYDGTGIFLSENEPKTVNETQVKSVCRAFQGEQLQTPPMFSAVKVKGQRLYKLARQGLTAERKPRKIWVYEIELLSYRNPLFSIRVTCSKGTYLRALAHDIGESLGCGAYLRNLVRTRIGDYRIEDACKLTIN